jgi:hypothetical protein
MAVSFFWILKSQNTILGIFLGPQTAALIFLPRVAFSVIIFDRLIGNYYFTLKRVLLSR